MSQFQDLFKELIFENGWYRQNMSSPEPYGDGLNRMSQLILLAQLAGEKEISFMLCKIIMTDSSQPVRNPFKAPWNNPKNVTRDQLLTAIMAMETTDFKYLYCPVRYDEHRARWFRYPNTEKDWPGTKKKFPNGADFTTLDDLAVWLRIRRKPYADLFDWFFPLSVLIYCLRCKLDYKLTLDQEIMCRFVYSHLIKKETTPIKLAKKLYFRLRPKNIGNELYNIADPVVAAFRYYFRDDHAGYENKAFFYLWFDAIMQLRPD